MLRAFLSSVLKNSVESFILFTNLWSETFQICLNEKDLRQIGEELHSIIKNLINEELLMTKQQQVSQSHFTETIVV